MSDKANSTFNDSQSLLLSEAEDASITSQNDDNTLRLRYTTSGLNAITLHIVQNLDEIKNEKCQRSFKPVLFHQIFGPKELIYGYKDLKIDIYVAANSAQCYLNIRYSEKIDDVDSLNSVPADRVVSLLRNWLPDDTTQNKSKFIRTIMHENFSKKFGLDIDTFKTRIDTENETYEYVITKCSIEEDFVKFHERFQCLLVWFIDGASLIDMEDPNWMFFYVYEHRKVNNKDVYYPVGFCTLYKFYHYPEQIRTRISQFFIIPSCQRYGLGTKLLKAVYVAIKSLPNVYDITVEDPCYEFTKMRDLVDCKLVSQLNSFKYPNITKGYTHAMFIEANKHFKLNKRQCRRVYEILCFALLPPEILNDVIKQIKKRFHDANSLNSRQLSRRFYGNRENSQREKEDEMLEDDVKGDIKTYTNILRLIAHQLTSFLKAAEEGN